MKPITLNKLNNKQNQKLVSKKRYVAIVEFYVWSDTDEEAIEKANSLCKEQASRNDDQCKLIKLVEQPFGEIGNKEVGLKNTLQETKN